MFRIITTSIIILAASCSGNENNETSTSPQPEKTVRVAEVKKDNLSIQVQSVGTLASKDQSNLSFLTGGIIDRIFVSEGEVVMKGQLLARLDMTEIESRVKQASLSLEKAQRDFDRVESLYEDTVATLEQYQDSRTALEVAQANYKIAGFNKQNSEIRAPSNGKILKKLKESNENVGSGHPVLVFASTEADWILTVNLSDRDIVRVNLKDSAIISFDAYPGEEFEATISEIANSANPLSGTYEVELQLIDYPEKLVTGLIGQAIIYPPEKSYLIIPPESLVEATGRTGIVFQLVDEKPVRKSIDILALTESAIIIKNGLKEGDIVVTEGNAWIEDGENIKVKN
jgi:RND family efflux transporter MFP subunit